MSSEEAAKALADGVAPLEIEYIPVKNSAFLSNEGYRGVLRINSLELGVLYPEQYRLVTNRNLQSTRLASWAMDRVCRDMLKMREAGIEADFVSVYVPTKMLMRKTLSKLLDSATELLGKRLEGLCLEFSSDILLEETESVNALLEDVRHRYGVSFMLCEYGDTFCPTMRLCGLHIDLVLLDETASREDALAEIAVRSTIKLAKSCGLKVYADRIKDLRAPQMSKAAGCDGFCEYRGRSIDEVTAQ